MRGASALLVLLLLLAGCGAGGGGKEVKSALKDFILARSNGDVQAICAGMTPESRRMYETLGRGLLGPPGDCERTLDDPLFDLSGVGVTGQDLEAIDSVDVDIDGDMARVKNGSRDERLPMKKVGGTWRVDVAHIPGQGYGLQASARCTEDLMASQRMPLPPPTRRGIANDADQDAKRLTALVRVLEANEPPDGQEDDHEKLVTILKRQVDNWRRAAKGLRGVAPPIDTYNKALKGGFTDRPELQRTSQALGISCLGTIETLKPAREYRQQARRICRAAGRRISRVGNGPAAPSRLGAIGRSAAAALRRLEPPKHLAELHRASVAALADGYSAIAGLSSDDEDEVNAVELRALRSSIGFFRLGSQACGEL
jgi:hypothetical protein